MKTTLSGKCGGWVPGDKPGDRRGFVKGGKGDAVDIYQSSRC
jgi:hypothetical protein